MEEALLYGHKHNTQIQHKELDLTQQHSTTTMLLGDSHLSVV